MKFLFNLSFMSLNNLTTTLSSISLDDIGLLHVKRCAILVEHVMEPHLRLGGTLWWTPRIDRLSLATDEAPVYGTHVGIMEEGNVSLEFGVYGTGHVFGTDSGTTVTGETIGGRFGAVEGVVDVEGYDVGSWCLEV